jgi:hypothetical protein
LTVGLLITVVAIAFESIAVATAMPVAAQDLQALSYYSWAFSLFLVGMLFSTVLAGRLSDRIGPARPLQAGFAVFAAGLILAGSAQHITQLVAGRLVQSGQRPDQHRHLRQRGPRVRRCAAPEDLHLSFRRVGAAGLRRSARGGRDH